MLSARKFHGTVLLALLAAAGALWMRVAIPFHRVVRDGWINFQGDGWYHMRAIEHLVRNFPHRLAADPYAGLPALYVAIAPLFDYVVATTAMIAGAGAPSAALVSRVAAYTPALLGALAVLLVYALGTRVFDRRTGVLAAALLAIMPGPLLDRTLLGATDHHALEVVLVLAVMYFVTGVARAPAGRSRTNSAWAAGLVLGAYYLTWTSAPLFAFAVALWASVQFLFNRGWSHSSVYLSALLVRMAGLAIVLVLAGQNPAIFRYRLQLESLAGLLALGALIGAAERSRLPRRMALAVAGSAVLAAGATLALGVWHLPDGLLQDLARFHQGSLGRTVSEMQPLLAADGRLSLAAPWRVFRTAFYVGVPALLVLGVRSVVERDSGARSLLVVWGTVSLAATLGQIRFGYYLSPMLALLTGWVCSAGIDWLASRARRRWIVEAAVVAAIATIFYPSLRLSLAAVSVDDGMPDPWKRSLDWLRLDTVDPFGDPETYYRRYAAGSMPHPSYTVMSWWDYGYWVIRAGRRVPVATPTQDGAAQAARFFVSTNEATALALLAEAHARYVLADGGLAFRKSADGHTLAGKFDGVVQWAGRRERDFFETLTIRGSGGRPSSIVVFYPDYYRTMAVRLSRFPTGGVEPDDGVWVVSIDERMDADGIVRREIARSRRFATYDAAEAYRATLGPGEHRIVGLDPLHSCVPLPAVRGLRLVHEEASTVDSVRIFTTAADRGQN